MPCCFAASTSFSSYADTLFGALAFVSRPPVAACFKPAGDAVSIWARATSGAAVAAVVGFHGGCGEEDFHRRFVLFVSPKFDFLGFRVAFSGTGSGI
jgi:hypothetical protein